jgi:hypothetical protein
MKEITMATVTAPPPSSVSHPAPAATPEASPSPKADPPAEAFRPDWEHFGTKGDRIAYLFWLLCFVLLAGMIFGEMLVGLFR